MLMFYLLLLRMADSGLMKYSSRPLSAVKIDLVIYRPMSLIRLVGEREPQRRECDD